MLKEYVHYFTHSLTHSHNNIHMHSQMEKLLQEPALKTVVLANLMKCVVTMVDGTLMAVNSDSKTV